MSTIPLRVLIWGISILALLGNGVVLLVLLGTEQEVLFKGRIYVMSYYTSTFGHFHKFLCLEFGHYIYYKKKKIKVSSNTFYLSNKSVPLFYSL